MNHQLADHIAGEIRAMGNVFDRDVLRATYAPNKVVAVVAENEVAALANRLPLVKGKRARKGRTTAYVCERGVCQLPTSDADVFVRQLSARAPKEAP